MQADKHRKPVLTGREEPKLTEAVRNGPGMRYLKPGAPKCRAVDPAFRPSRAGKSLIRTPVGIVFRSFAIVKFLNKVKDKFVWRWRPGKFGHSSRASTMI